MLPLEVVVHVEDDDDGDSRWDEVVEVGLSNLAFGRLAELLYARLAGRRSWFADCSGERTGGAGP